MSHLLSALDKGREALRSGQAGAREMSELLSRASEVRKSLKELREKRSQGEAALAEELAEVEAIAPVIGKKAVDAALAEAAKLREEWAAAERPLREELARIKERLAELDSDPTVQAFLRLAERRAARRKIAEAIAGVDPQAGDPATVEKLAGLLHRAEAAHLPEVEQIKDALAAAKAALASRRAAAERGLPKWAGRNARAGRIVFLMPQRGSGAILAPKPTKSGGLVWEVAGRFGPDAPAKGAILTVLPRWGRFWRTQGGIRPAGLSAGFVDVVVRATREGMRGSVVNTAVSRVRAGKPPFGNVKEAK